MKLYLNRESYSAKAEYNVEEKDFVVLKGSTVSANVSNSTKFRGVSTIIKLRETYTEGNVVVNDVHFRSPSTAANFVTGVSTNGLKTWKTKDGVLLKTALGS